MPIRTSTVTIPTRNFPPISAPVESRPKSLSEPPRSAPSFMRLDLHNHTQHSPDSRVSPADLVARARQVGLDGTAITDHNSVAGLREAEGAAVDLTVIPGTEISTRPGHVKADGVRAPVRRDLSVLDTVE